MNKVVNTYSIDNRLRSQRVIARTPLNARNWSRKITGTRTDAHRHSEIIPSWVIIAVAVLVMIALCATVTMRFYTKANVATKQHEEINKEIELLRSGNRALEDEVRRLQNDPRTIESVARKRLNMVRENEIIMPVE